ncbi:MAG: hypothetical protein RR555_11000 [Bacteroidales bacterium]
MEVTTPIIKIIYAKKDVSADFLPILKQLTYTDNLSGTASDLDMELDNRKEYFFNDWYPAVGDEVKCQLGYKGSALLDCGTFYVDEASLSNNGADTCNIRAISLPVSALHNTVQKKRKEGSVSSIVKEVAAELKMSAKGDLSGEWKGMQNESGLKFLSRIARETGRILKVEGLDIVFYNITDLAKSAQLTIQRSDTSNYDIRDKAAGRYKICTVKHWDKKQKLMFEGTAETQVEGGAITVWEDVSDASAARTRAKEILTSKNKSGLEISLSLPGDVRLQAGVSVKIDGFGRFDAVYFIDQAKHIISETGYTCAIILQRNAV